MWYYVSKIRHYIQTITYLQQYSIFIALIKQLWYYQSSGRAIVK